MPLHGLCGRSSTLAFVVRRASSAGSSGRVCSSGGLAFALGDAPGDQTMSNLKVKGREQVCFSGWILTQKDVWRDDKGKMGKVGREGMVEDETDASLCKR